MSAGRPTDFEPRFVQMAAKACELGATDKDLAELFDVSEATINAWKIAHPEFLESIKAAKLTADKNVERSLYQRAIGYEHPDTHFASYEGQIISKETVKRYPPSEVACIFWLKNRKPKDWRDKQEVALENPDGTALFSPELIAAAAAIAKKS